MVAVRYYMDAAGKGAGCLVVYDVPRGRPPYCREVVDAISSRVLR